MTIVNPRQEREKKQQKADKERVPEAEITREVNDAQVHHRAGKRASGQPFGTMALAGVLLDRTRLRRYVWRA